MLVYRLCKRHHINLDGEGAKLFGGRWNSRGIAAVYASQSLSLAVLESLVHFDFDELPDNLVWLEIEIPDSIEVMEYKREQPSERTSRQDGDKWLSSLKTACLVVPSVVIPIEKNVILNPGHSDMSRIKVRTCEDFQLDPRFVKGPKNKL